MGAAYEVLGDPAARAEYDLVNPIKKTKTVSRSAGAAAAAAPAGAGLQEVQHYLKQMLNFYKRIDNARHTVVYNTKDTLEELLEEARRRGLNHRTRYTKAKNVLNSLSKKSKGSKRRRTRKA
jgi:DnaJ-class molecular chaperone